MNVKKEFQELQCDDCGLVFCEYKQFLFHRKYHSGLFQNGITEEFRLEENCSLCFVKHFELFRDVLLKRQKFQCDDCSLVFYDYNQFLLHRKYHISLPRIETPGETVLRGSCPLCFEDLRLDSEKTFEECDLENKTKQIMRCKYYPDCREVFYRLFEFINHIKEVHNDSKPYSCQQCVYTTARYYDLRRHLFSHMGFKMFKCRLCSKRYTAKMNLDFHLSFVHKEGNRKVPECSICGKKFAKPRSLKKHLKAHLPASGTFKCHLCPREYFRKNTFEYHLKTHSKMFTCQFCRKGYATKLRLKVHLLSSHNELNIKSHDCSYCGKKFLDPSVLKTHLKRHLPHSAAFKCHICSKEVSSKRILQDHLERHDNAQKNFSCSTCPKRFASKDCLRKHELRHSGKKPFSCDFCDKKFYTPADRNKHQLTHFDKTGQPKQLYDCKDCGHQFMVEISLKRHLDPDKESKDILCCKHCPKTFKNINCFMYHDKSHRELSCAICKKKFFTPKSLRNHSKKVHGITSGSEKSWKPANPFKCSLCPKEYRSRQSLKEHVRKHEDREPHVCKHCGKSYMAEMYLKVHLDPKKETKQPLSCKECSKTFTNVNCFNYHKYSHSEEYFCEVCNVKVLTRDGLKRHLARHEVNSTPTL